MGQSQHHPLVDYQILSRMMLLWVQMPGGSAYSKYDYTNQTHKLCTAQTLIYEKCHLNRLFYIPKKFLNFLHCNYHIAYIVSSFKFILEVARRFYVV